MLLTRQRRSTRGAGSNRFAGRGLLAILAVGLVATACAGSTGTGSPGTGSTSSTAVDGRSAELVVFAAASLTDAFTAIGDAFMAEHPGATVTFQFAGSSDLAAQLENGAPADVFASADATNMARVVDNGAAAGSPVVFATNVLQMATAPGNPLGVATLADLVDPALTVVLCAAEVPCGRYTQQVLDAAGVVVTPKSWEQSVKGVLSKVSLGEADAGVVYRTDVIAAKGAVDGVDIDAGVAVTAQYPLVVTSETELASAFVDFVLGDAGRRILLKFGFGVP